jgi:uncharacterized C2H2 Zn-finger protein
MFGFGINLTKVFNYLQTKKYKKCFFCNKYFKNKIDLDDHINKEHSTETGTVTK